MPFTDRIRVTAVLLSCLLVLPQARGQETGAGVAAPGPVVDFGEGVHFEVTPHTGMMGGSGTFGLRLGADYGALQIELAGEQVIGRTANLYPISGSALLNLSTRGRVIPYGTVGAALLITVPTNTIGDRTVSTLGVSFGGGARYFLTPGFGFRGEVKQYMTSVSHATEPGTDLLTFQEWSLGVVFLFR